MTANGHIGFNQRAFTVGAIGGAATIVGAMVAGVRNAAAASRERAR